MTPVDFNYLMPPEWAKHLCTFMEWPRSEWFWGDGISAARLAYAKVAQVITGFEPVVMLVHPDLASQAATLCGPEITILPIEHDDSWVRDNGPTFISNPAGHLAGINWRFNAWGSKTPGWEADDRVPPLLLYKLGLKCFSAPIILEGGSIHVDGNGTLITTEQCLLHPNRNPRLGKAEITEFLKQYLNIRKIIWLKNGLDGDETDGHVDNVACFARPGTVLIQSCSDPDDPNYQSYLDNRAILDAETDSQGRRLRVIPIEQPPLTYYRGKRLPLSYINFYLVNGGVVFPVFGGKCSKTDRLTRQTLEAVFPERRVVPVNGMEIIKGGGNIHCITQQMPATRCITEFNWRFFNEEDNSCSYSNELQLEY
jgi:agmatine deiminase